MGILDMSPEKKPTWGNLAGERVRKEICPLPSLHSSYLQPAPHRLNTTRRQIAWEPTDVIHTTSCSWAHERVGKGQAGTFQHHSSNNTENCGLEASWDNRIFHEFNPKPQAVDFNNETRMFISATNKAGNSVSYVHDTRRMQILFIS